MRITLTSTPGRRNNSTPKHCGCGCGEMTRGGRFRPGHDGALYGLALRLESRAINATEAVDRGWATEEHIEAAIGYGRERGLAMEGIAVEPAIDLTEALTQAVEEVRQGK